MKWFCTVALALLMLSACNDTNKKNTNRNTSSTGTGSVYDSGNAGSSEMDEGTEVVQEDPDSFTSYVADESIDSNEIGVLNASADAQNAALDWQPVLFDFDQSSLTESARQRLVEYANILKNRPEVSVLLEGHSDMRGTENYNLALGERRAQAVKRFFMSLGVNAQQLRTISYGELRPADPGNNERAWATNRRVAFVF